jgi:hypothetical protein
LDTYRPINLNVKFNFKSYKTIFLNIFVKTLNNIYFKNDEQIKKERKSKTCFA